MLNQASIWRLDLPKSEYYVSMIALLDFTLSCGELMYIFHTRDISTAPENQRKSFNETYSNPHNSRKPVEQRK